MNRSPSPSTRATSSRTSSLGRLGDRGLEPHELGLGDELRDQLADLVELAPVALAQRVQLAERLDAQLGGRGRRHRAARRELLRARFGRGGVEVGPREHRVELAEPLARLAQPAAEHARGLGIGQHTGERRRLRALECGQQLGLAAVVALARQRERCIERPQDRDQQAVAGRDPLAHGGDREREQRRRSRCNRRRSSRGSLPVLVIDPARRVERLR